MDHFALSNPHLSQMDAFGEPSTHSSPVVCHKPTLVARLSESYVLIGYPSRQDRPTLPQNEGHSRMLVTVQLILQQTFVGKCVYIRVPFMMSLMASEFHRGGRKNSISIFSFCSRNWNFFQCTHSLHQKWAHS